jgi:hypothetical protein
MKALILNRKLTKSWEEKKTKCLRKTRFGRSLQVRLKVLKGLAKELRSLINLQSMKFQEILLFTIRELKTLIHHYCLRLSIRKMLRLKVKNTLKQSKQLKVRKWWASVKKWILTSLGNRRRSYLRKKESQWKRKRVKSK